jgi:hypothetical protein
MAMADFMDGGLAPAVHGATDRLPPGGGPASRISHSSHRGRFLVVRLSSEIRSNRLVPILIFSEVLQEATMQPLLVLARAFGYLW